MMIMKNLTRYTPDVNPYNGSGVIVAFYRDEEGRDWYESQALFSADTLKMCYRDNGVIAQCACDVSALAPAGLSVAEVGNFAADAGASLIDGTWVFNGKDIVKRTYTAEEIQQLRAGQQRQSLITTANSTIRLWQSELLPGSIADDDKDSLTKWIAYIKALQALDFSGIRDEVSYKTIEWTEPL